MTAGEKLTRAVEMAEKGYSNADIVRATGLKAVQVAEIKQRIGPRARRVRT